MLGSRLVYLYTLSDIVYLCSEVQRKELGCVNIWRAAMDPLRRSGDSPFQSLGYCSTPT